MKIRCKSCGKHFDPEVYSGLCPKCGTYNRIQGDESSRYYSSGISGEEAHRRLHEAYGDTGHAADAHGRLHERYGDAGHVEDDHERLHDRYEDTGHTAGQGRARRIPALTIALAVLLVLIPAIFHLNFRFFEKRTAQTFLDQEIEEIFPVDHTLVFAGAPFEEPVTVEVLRMEALQAEGLAAEGKRLLAVWLRACCEGYNFDAAVNRAVLGYELEGIPFYVEPVDYWHAEEYLYGSGLSRRDILSTYSLGDEEEQEGCFLFLLPENGEKLSLLLMAGKGEGDSLLFKEGTIPLDDSLLTGDTR